MSDDAGPPQDHLGHCACCYTAWRKNEAGTWLAHNGRLYCPSCGKRMAQRDMAVIVSCWQYQCRVTTPHKQALAAGWTPAQGHWYCPRHIEQARAVLALPAGGGPPKEIDQTADLELPSGGDAVWDAMEEARRLRIQQIDEARAVADAARKEEEERRKKANPRFWNLLDDEGTPS